MARLEDTISKFVPLYDKNIITSHELVDLFVHQVIESHREPDSASLLALLPPEVAAEVLPFVRELLENGYDSHPPPVGRPRTKEDIAEATIGLREMDRVLSMRGKAPTS